MLTTDFPLIRFTLIFQVQSSTSIVQSMDLEILRILECPTYQNESTSKE